MLTTPVERRFSRSFRFSICPLPFLALGPEFLPGSGPPSRSSAAAGTGDAPAGPDGAAAGAGSSSGRRAPPGPALQCPGAGAAGAAVAAAATPDPDPDPASEPAGPGALCLARSFSRFAFHSSRKSAVLPPAAR